MTREGAFYQREGFIYFVAILASILLSTWINSHETVINVDAICYILSADTFARAGLHEAMLVCPQAKWPFYSVLIYSLSAVTSFSYITAAYVLDGFFSLLTVVTFVAVIKELSGSRRLMWLGLTVILLSHQFNSVRQYIVRDHGFWAFYLASLFFLLRYFSSLHWRHALAWSISLLIAAMFRIEGALFLLTLPFLSWFCFNYSRKQRASLFLSLYLPVLGIVACIAGWQLLHPQQTLNQLGRVHEIVNQFQHGITITLENFVATKQALAQHVLSKDSVRDAGLILTLTLSICYVFSVLGNLSWIYSLLLAYAFITRAARFTRQSWLVLSGYLLVNLLITAVFFVQHLFLSKRYLIALSLILMFWVPFALNKLLQQAVHWRGRLLLAGATAMVLISSLGGIIDFGYSKAYIRDAGTWVAKNVPEKAAVYINDYQVMYYAQRYRTHLDASPAAKWRDYDYIVLRVGKQENAETLALVQEIPLAPVKAFMNKRGDKVLIYRSR